jgi:hypothetical protein
MGCSKLRYLGALAEWAARISGSGFGVRVPYGAPNGVYIGAGVLGLGDRTCSRIHVADLGWQASSAGDDAPLLRIFRLCVRSAGPLVDNQGADAIFFRDNSSNRAVMGNSFRS